jgi:hypothetical protein
LQVVRATPIFIFIFGERGLIFYLTFFLVMARCVWLKSLSIYKAPSEAEERLHKSDDIGFDYWPVGLIEYHLAQGIC